MHDLVGRYIGFVPRWWGSPGQERPDSAESGGPDYGALHDAPRTVQCRERRRVLPIVAVALIGVVVSIAAWLMLSRWEQRIAEVEFRGRSENAVLTLQSGISQHLQQLYAMRALFDASPGEVSRASFEIFSLELLRERSSIQAISWLPLVTREERAAHESAAARQGIIDYRIRSVSQTGVISPAEEHDEYFPVFYTINRESSTIYGVDLNDGGMRQDALRRARDSDAPAASSVFLLQTGIGDRRGFFAVLPVYRRGMPHDTVEARRRNLEGYVLAVFQTGALIDTILGPIKTARTLYVFAPGSDADARPMFVQSNAGQAHTQPMRRELLTGTPHWSGELTVADSRWPIVIAPGANGPMGGRTAWLVAAASLLLTMLVVTFMVSSNRYARRLVQANDKFAELARTDVLTQLANRRAFLDRLESAFAACHRGAAPFAVLYFDLDHFKDVNDTLGHPTGDLLLLQVAERLKGIIRRTDTVARFGGDEFAVLQSGAVDMAAAGTLAAKIVETLAAPYPINGNDVHVTASVGVSRYAEGLSGPEAIMMQADLALYRAKEDGRNCFRFHTESLDRQIRERVTVADDLRFAITRHQLELYYQPQVELATGRIVGLEALLRWNHPIRGQVSPALFIPIAERTGNIVQLGNWVLDEACRQLKLWQNAGVAPETLAVNVSGVQCKQSDLERGISDTLAKWDVGAESLEIELTESVLMEVTQENHDLIQRLGQMGLKIAIDDFGTGYSSLNYLTNYPVHRLKVAQELVLGVTRDVRHASVVRTAIRLAEELHVGLIAEGVETKAQAEFLLSAGCVYAQGYYFSRPVTAARATELLRQGVINPSEPAAGSLGHAA